MGKFGETLLIQQKRLYKAEVNNRYIQLDEKTIHYMTYLFTRRICLFGL